MIHQPCIYIHTLSDATAPTLTFSSFTGRLSTGPLKPDSAELGNVHKWRKL